ncbi:MAG: DNA gyrase C-terminal beta-propeller domain-containing protein [Polyangiales bacterium]
MVVTDKGQMLRTFVSQVRLAGRNTQGVRIIDVNEGEKVVAIERVEVVTVEGEPRPSLSPTDSAASGDAGAPTTPAEPSEPATDA